MTQIRRRKQEVLFFVILLAIIGSVYGTQAPANYGIKTKTYQLEPMIETSKTYQLEPMIETTYGQQQQQPQQHTTSYHRTTTIERLSPEQSTSTSYHSATNYNSRHNENNDNEFQYQQPTNSNWQDAENAITEYYTGCPAEHTGPLPYAYDCRRFLNCWHGRGHIQSCAAGTVFNPETLECDRPNKVVCGTLGTLGAAAANSATVTTTTDSHSQQYRQHQQQLAAGHTGSNANYRNGRLADVATENIDVLCPQGMSGLQQHPNDCTKFINCANGNVHVQQCGPGTAYNPSMMVCDFKDKVNCGTRAYHYGEGMIDLRALDGNTHALQLEKSSKVSCPTDAAGLYPHPYDCAKFLNCANGITYVQNCGPGTAFDREHKICDFKHKVKSCGNGVTTTTTATTYVVGHGVDFNQVHGYGDKKTVNSSSSLIVDIFCPSGVTGLFVHPFDYTKFLSCRNGETKVQSCVVGKVFSIARGYCDFKEEVEYTDRVSYIVSEVSYEYSRMLMSCPPEIEGLHLYPYDCTKYIKCDVGGRLLILECQPNFVFSIIRRMCLSKQQVKSKDRVKFIFEFNSSNSLYGNRKESSLAGAITDFDSARMVGCPSGTTGLYPYPFDSIKYVRCRSGHLTIETCASGKAFSLSRKQCMLKEKLEPNDMVLYRREFAEEWSNEVSYGYGQLPGFAYLICPPKIDDGVFLHPFDCLKYISCTKGSTSVENCPTGKVFSISKEHCVNRDQVEPYDRVEYLIDVQHEFSLDLPKVDNEQTYTVCTPNAVGLYAYTDNPRKYLKCTADFQTFIESCAPGTYFSISKRYCDLEDRVGESDRSVYTRNFEFETNNSWNGKNNELLVTCPPNADGLQSHPYDCTKFLNCANGKTVIQSCGPGTAWSQQMEVCAMKDTVDCSGRVENSQSKISCPDGFHNGYYPHPFDYTRYFSCLNGQSYVARCNEGSVFSVSKRRCESAEKISLQDRVIQMTEYLTEVNTLQNSNADFIVCPAKGTGFYVYPFDCTKYVNCQAGLTTVDACNEGAVFSMSRQMCLPQLQVKRVDRVSFLEEIHGDSGQQWQNNQVNSENYVTTEVACRPGVTGMQPHPFDCTKFLNCANGETHVQSCGPDTAWSKDMEVCDLKDKVDCMSRTGREGSYDVRNDSYAQFSSNSYTHRQTSQHELQQIACPSEIDEGFYPHPFDYNQYFICQRGQSVLGHCSPGNVFSISKRFCDASSRVSTTDRVVLLAEYVSEVDVAGSTQSSGFVYCPQRTVGIFVYPFDCNKFVKCDQGRTSIEICPAESVFSLSNRMCVSKHNVQTFDRVAYLTETQNDLYYRQNNEANYLIASNTFEAKCPTGANGMYSHPFDCTKFLNCANGITYVQSCGPRTVWNDAAKVCDFPHKVDCSGRSGKLRESKSITSNSIGKGASIECPKGFVGLYPHPYDCTRFLNCENGATHIQACGPGTAWNSAMEVCDFLANVDCSPQSRTYTNGGAKQYGGSTTTTGQYGTQSSNSWTQTNTQQNYGSGAGSTGYTDRWSNMNMARPDAKSYGQTTGSGGSNTWTAGSYGQQHGQHTSTVSGHGDTNWSAVGSSIDHRTPTESTLYMEGSLVPNRNYVNTLNINNAPPTPLAPFSSNAANGTTTKIVYAQPVNSEESSFDHIRGSDRTRTFTSTDRQNHSRHINHLSPANSWTPVVQHETTLETHTAQLPNTQLMPPLQTPALTTPTNRQTYDMPNTHLMPPYQGSNDRQQPIDLDRGQMEVSDQDHIQSGSNFSPVFSPTAVDASNLFGGLQPPPLSSSTSNNRQHNLYRPTPPPPPSQSNLYGGLQPPLSHTNTRSTDTFNISRTLQAPIAPTQSSNVRIQQVYPPIPTATSIKSHGNPHYSSPYSGVAHSRNTTWVSTRMNVDTIDLGNDSEPVLQNPSQNVPLLATTSKTERRVASMPPSYNRQYYQTTTSSSQQPTPIATDLVDTELPLSDALRMLLRPYFNRSGIADEQTAHEAESHIMRLVVDSTTPTPKPSIATRFAPPYEPHPSTTADDTQQQQQSEEDVELILAGEQHSLITVTSRNGTREVRTHFQANQEKFNDTKVTENWHTGHGQTREFHLRHPNLPNPYPADAKRTDTNDAKYSQNNWQTHNHHDQHAHNHQHHNRNFHLRHPELPSPFATTREGDRSIQSTDAFDIPNPYAESTTPSFAIHSRSSVLDSKHDCQFDCGNGKCAQRFEVCNGVDDCGNHKDESQCDHLGYQVRLTGGEKPHMGRIEVKVLGKWGYVCDDKFGLLDADVVCRELGFKSGASEVRGNSFYPPLEVNVAFSMDEVECRGNETSLKDCKFKGWGVHNCGPDEVAGVVCKVPLMKCPNNYWLCSTSQECIPPDFVCDHTPDCADKSDESDQVCNSPIQYRLEGGRNKYEGRLEVKYRGEWGTVCDDDFGLREAQVACNSMGYYGKPTVERNIYGPGSGPIWLDQVACLGNETSIDKCTHWNWGEQNCNHTEDVGIRCTVGPPPKNLLNNNRRSDEYDDVQQQQQTELDDVMELYQSTLERSSKFLRAQPNCGHFKPNLFDEYAHPEQERVVNGTIAKRGRHPWQATIRTRGRGGISSHWCGAVLIGDGNTQHSSYLLTAAHCLAGYQKGAYFVRMGDHYANIAESSETDAYIENWYVHEKFRDQKHMNNDIALIVLKSPVRFNDYIQPVCLPEKGKTLQTGRECTISGWGSIKSGVSTPSNILRAAQVPVLSDETCRQPHVYGASMTEGMFCAGSLDESVDACDGDSGGPLVCSDEGTDTLYGIISWGQHCGYANKPGVYVRIEKYIDWIYEKINFSLQQSGKLNGF